jgi:type I restriction enzyme S subunit
LLAGNGDFSVKRYRGKFEAYQRTYVLIPYQEIYIGFLFVLMKYFLREITVGARGSVIDFLTKGMITDYEFKLPANRDTVKDKFRVLNELEQKVDFNTDEIRTLTQLRDTLLPKLMNGEVRVKET